MDCRARQVGRKWQDRRKSRFDVHDENGLFKLRLVTLALSSPKGATPSLQDQSWLKLRPRGAARCFHAHPAQNRAEKMRKRGDIHGPRKVALGLRANQPRTK